MNIINHDEENNNIAVYEEQGNSKNNLINLIIFDCKNCLNRSIENVVALSKFLLIICFIVFIIMMFKIMQIILNK